MNIYFNKIKASHRGKFFANVIKSLADAFGLSLKTILSVVNDENSKDKNYIDTLDKELIRRVIHKFYTEKQLPTIDKIHSRLENEHGYIIKRYKLRLTLLKMGF